MADKVHTSALRLVSDDELTGMIKAWRRLTSWATAQELSAIAEMARRSPEEVIDTPLARRIQSVIVAPPAKIQRRSRSRLGSGSCGSPRWRGEPSGPGRLS